MRQRYAVLCRNRPSDPWELAYLTETQALARREAAAIQDQERRVLGVKRFRCAVVPESALDGDLGKIGRRTGSTDQLKSTDPCNGVSATAPGCQETVTPAPAPVAEPVQVG